MELNVADLTPHERYKTLAGTVFPRPIALISTYSENGVANCAPYSFFNGMCEDPMLVVVSFSARSDGKPKHSFANLMRTGSFVVNLVDEPIANGMHLSSAEVPEEVSEFVEAGFTVAPCTRVPHPRIAEAPVAFECRLYQHIPVGHARDLVLGEVLVVHSRDGVIDPDTKRIADREYVPVGRIFGTRYCTTRQRYELPGKLPD